MNSSRFRLRSRQGSALLGVLVLVGILAILLGSVLRFSTNTNTNSARQAHIERAKLVAESEMEYLFYRWIAEVNRRTASFDVPTHLISDGVCGTNPSDELTPFSSEIASDGWHITRSIDFYAIPGTTDGSAIGRRQDSSNIGRNYYFTARVKSSRDDPLFGAIEYKAGRRFIRTETSILQNSIFYQGDLEIASGSDMIINGPISTNGSAYIGAQSGKKVVIMNKLRYFDKFNGDTNKMNGTQMRKDTGSTLNAPTFDPDPNDAYTPDQTDARSNQVERLAAMENFVGGVDPTEAITKYPNAYRNRSGDPDVNEVYRSIIAPPPTDSGGVAIPEDPTVATRRMYNRAGIVITISRDGSGDPVVDIGTPDDKTAFNVLAATHVDMVVPVADRRKAVYDKREGRSMAMTTLDVQALNNALDGIAALKSAYNGVLYIHDVTNGGDGGGIRLINGSTTPNVLDTSGQPKGFALVTNNALYVQGDYNTTAITDSETGTRNNPAALMGDAVTLLSHGWIDENSDAPMWGDSDGRDRIARMDPLHPTEITINSAILTGNTPTASGFNSGGVQNLVRLLEDWSGAETHIKGSMGQLFHSKFMTEVFRGPDKPLTRSADAGDSVYWTPASRTLEFDEDLARRPPAWTPTTTEFHRGDFFVWQ